MSRQRERISYKFKTKACVRSNEIGDSIISKPLLLWATGCVHTGAPNSVSGRLNGYEIMLSRGLPSMISVSSRPSSWEPSWPPSTWTTSASTVIKALIYDKIKGRYKSFRKCMEFGDITTLVLAQPRSFRILRQSFGENVNRNFQ